jgi:spore coat polysaccharide biosynthesis protein SpsF
MGIAAVIVQARTGSSRLPGKVLMDLAGTTALDHCLSRCKLIPGIGVVCCATTFDPADDAVAAEAGRIGALVFRGSVDDVLARYHGAAMAIGAETVMRVTSDCPLIDPELCGQVLALKREKKVDYACNNLPPSFPHGLDCEAFSAAALAQAFHEAKRPYEREHVTPYIREQACFSRAYLEGPRDESVRLRWTLDYPEDLEFFRALARRLPAPPIFPGWQEIVAVLDEHPEITAINAGRIDEARLKQVRP